VPENQSIEDVSISPKGRGEAGSKDYLQTPRNYGAISIFATADKILQAFQDPSIQQRISIPSALSKRSVSATLLQDIAS
jgi:hypothetical protein